MTVRPPGAIVGLVTGRRIARVRALDTSEPRGGLSTALGRALALLRARLRGPDGFALAPEARSYGSAARGRRLVEGCFNFAGARVEAPGTLIWDLPFRAPAFARELHGFGWLNDLAAEGSAAAHDLARDWTFEWIARFDRAPSRATRAATGPRLLRWLAHSDLLLDGATGAARRAFFRSLARQARELARYRKEPAAALDLIEARVAALLCAICLPGPARHVWQAAASLARAAEARIDGDGAIASRNPEELTEIFARLVEARIALDAAGRPVPPSLEAAIGRAAPVLRSLRHGDGALARFHSGGRGAPGRLDQALAGAGDRPLPPVDRAMGFARLAAGRTTLILDGASPPTGPDAATAHASTLAFELTSGRRPLIVSCGPGARFGRDWGRAGRATPSHSTLVLDGISSARLEGARLVDAPRDVRIERRRNEHATGFIAGHDGYVASYGLTHVRQLFLSDDGREIEGEDVLATVEREDEAIFDRAMDEAVWEGITFRLRFHLHPDVLAEPTADAGTVALDLPSGERWLFHHQGRAALSVEPGVYLDGDATAPRPALQIVLATRAVDYATRLRWTLAKSRETPDAVRDLDHGDGPVLA